MQQTEYQENLKQILLERGLISDKSSPMNMTEFSNGYSNLTYLVAIEQREFVLRRPPAGAVKRGHDMSREFKVLSHLSGNFNKSPEAFFYEDNPEVIGSSFYLMEKIEGIILTTAEARKRNISSESFKHIYATWLNAFIELHQVKYEDIGLRDLGRPVGYVSRQVENWGKQYLKAATMEIPEAIKVIQWMEDNQPKDYEHAFIHNDYKYDNVVFKDDSWQHINAILDWEMCTLGDPMMDFGTSLAYWMRPSDGPAAQIIPSPTLFDGNPERSQIVEDYLKKTNRSANHIIFYYVYGLFKIAVIVQQIFYRYHKGYTDNPKFAKLDQACKLFNEMAWQSIQKKKIDHYF